MNSICDLHTHCLLSGHAYSSLTENIDAANERGLKYYGISDHQPDASGIGTGPAAFDALDHVPRKIGGLTFLKGCEFNIRDGGEVNPADIHLSHLDYGIASIHAYAYDGGRDIETVTNAYLKALDYPFIKILGHIDDGKFEADFDRIIKKAKDVHKLVEINNSSLKPGTSRKNTKENLVKILEICKKYNQPIILNTDAHIKYEVGVFEYAEDLLEETKFPKELVLNYNENLFKEYFNI